MDPGTFDLMFSFTKHQVLQACLELRLFDALSTGACGIDELANRIDCPPENHFLERLCNICVCLKMLHKRVVEEKAEYSNTEQTEKFLTSGSKTNQLGFLNMYDWFAEHCNAEAITACVRAGKFELRPVPAASASDDLFVKLWGSKETFQKSNAFMECKSPLAPYSLKQHGVDLSRYRHAVDLGGCYGGTIRSLKEIYPDIKITLADLPHILEEAKKYPPNLQVDMEYSSVDFFKGDLPAADLYILGHVIHAFADDKIDIILPHVYKALEKGGTILLLEKFIDQASISATLIDALALCVLPGKERTAEEYITRLLKAGFTDPIVHMLPDNQWYDALLATKL